MFALQLKTFKITCLVCNEDVVNLDSFHEGCWPDVGELTCMTCGTSERVRVAPPEPVDPLTEKVNTILRERWKAG